MYGSKKQVAETDTELDAKIDEQAANFRKEATTRDWRAIEGVDHDLCDRLRYKDIESAVIDFFDLPDNTLISVLEAVSEDFRDNLGLLNDLIGLRDQEA